jgi:hypothetical protein
MWAPRSNPIMLDRQKVALKFCKKVVVIVFIVLFNYSATVETRTIGWNHD